jgi:hypothetical protein
MKPTHLLYGTVHNPQVAGLLSVAQFVTQKRPPATYPPSGPCYLCGYAVGDAALPTSARLNDDTWTGHGTAVAVRSEWLCAACAFV